MRMAKRRALLLLLPLAVLLAVAWYVVWRTTWRPAARARAAFARVPTANLAGNAPPERCVRCRV